MAARVQDALYNNKRLPIDSTYEQTGIIRPYNSGPASSLFLNIERDDVILFYKLLCYFEANHSFVLYI